MPIKLPSKPSNKAKTHTILLPTTHDIPSPFIDYITITYTPQTADETYEMYNAISTHQDYGSVVRDAPSGSKGAYNRVKKIVIDSIKEQKKWPLFQWQYVKGSNSIQNVRITFVPKDLGAEGIIDLKHKLLTLGVDWSSLLKNGNVTRLDVTIDYPNLDINSSLYMPKQAAKTQHWYGQGILETITIGKSTGNQTEIYDRGKKREQNKQSGFSGVRIERRLKNLHRKLWQIKDLGNPFLSITLVKPLSNTSPVFAAAGDWIMFCDSASIRGLENALSLLTLKNRTIYRAHFKNSQLPEWQPVEIWNKWPAYLLESELLSPAL